MSSALDHIRYNCGIAGEEVAGTVDELEAQVSRLQSSVISLKKLLEAVTEATVPYLPDGSPMWSDELIQRVNEALK